jgi:predicted RNA-binding protein with PUA-like domain
MANTRCWLLKSEPDVYGIEDLERDGSTHWDGVRNYQARNFMRDEMKLGDLVLYYHSNAKPPGIVGIARVSKEGYPDASQFEVGNKYYAPKSKPENPTWILVDIEFVARFEQLVPLNDLKADTALEGMLVIRRGQRLSVQPVEAKHFKRVCALAGFDIAALPALADQP